MAIDYTGMKEEMIRVLLKEQQMMEMQAKKAEYDRFREAYSRIDTVMMPVPDWIKSGEYVINAGINPGLAKSIAQFVEKQQPVVEKSPEELMDDALDEAVRAARKAV